MRMPTTITRPAKTTARPTAAPKPDKFIRLAADLLKQAGDPTRLRVILALADGERHVGGLCELLGGISQPALSHHLALLRHGRIIEPRRSGKHNFYGLTDTGRVLAKTAKGLMEG